jgi:hypothetical protein
MSNLVSDGRIACPRIMVPVHFLGRERHETSSQTIPVSGGGRCRASGHVADRDGAIRANSRFANNLTPKKIIPNHATSTKRSISSRSGASRILFKDRGDSQRLGHLQAIADRNIVEYKLLEPEEVAG